MGLEAISEAALRNSEEAQVIMESRRAWLEKIGRKKTDKGEEDDPELRATVALVLERVEAIESRRSQYHYLEELIGDCDLLTGTIREILYSVPDAGKVKYHKVPPLPVEVRAAMIVKAYIGRAEAIKVRMQEEPLRYFRAA